MAEHVYAAKITGVTPYTLDQGSYQQHDVEHAAETVYAESFESGLGGWSAADGEPVSIIEDLGSNDAHTGTHYLQSYSDSAEHLEATAVHSVSGLVVGASYTLTVWGISTASAAELSIGIDGIGFSAPQAGTGTWAELTYTFTATSTAHRLLLHSTADAATTFGVWDDVRLTRDAWSESVFGWVPDVVTLDYYPLDIKAGTLTLDEGWAPYAQAALTVATPSGDVLDALDPRANPRVQISTSNGQTSRTFDLLLRERVIDHVPGETALQLSSDEALTQDYALVANVPDGSARLHTDSLRSIVSGVLDKVGASLEAGTTDASYTTDAVNQCTNPGPVDTTGWSAGATIGVGATSGSPSGHTAYMTSTGSGTPYIFSAPCDAEVKIGDTVTMSVTVRGDTNLNRIQINPHNNIGNVYYARPALQGITAGYTRVVQTWVADVAVPAGQLNIAALGYYSGGGTVIAGEALYVGSAVISVGSGITDGAYFDGDTSDTADYLYEWDGDANASASTRTALAGVDAELFDWTPGMSGWDFLEPLLSQAALRLFCDESRVWRLINNSYTVDGVVSIAQGFNVTEAADTISRDESAAWYDAVVVSYSWNDSTNTARVAYDSAAEDGYSKALFVEYERPYPGPGAAAYILSRSLGRGRVLDLTALSNYDATPAMEVSATLPDTPIQTGAVSSVTWDFGNDEMTVTSRGLIDTPTSAWVFLDEDETWNDSPTGASWTSEEVA